MLRNTEKTTFEEFATLHEFVETVKNRPHNNKRGLGNSSEENSEDFAGIPLAECWETCFKGIPTTVENMKKSLANCQKTTFANIERRRPCNHYTGYAPNVPNAIIGYPKSMRKNQKTPQKVKVINIDYIAGANAYVSSETLERSGTTVLSLVYALEKQGYRVQLRLFTDFSKGGGDYTFYSICAVVLKQYGQPLNIQKLSFPLTSVAMFRRLGFRWLETVPGLVGHEWHGYGRSINNINEIISYMKTINIYNENSIVLDYSYIEDRDFNVDKLMEELRK